ncbi:hypothetical protein [Ekhidna sp.]
MAFLRLTLLSLIILSCSESSPRPSNRSDLFSGTDSFGKTWQILEIEIELGTLRPNSCVLDNFITYYPNGVYEVREGATKCDPNDPPSMTGQWYLDDSEETLFVIINGDTQVWDIEETQTDSHRITSNFIEGNRTYKLILSN